MKALFLDLETTGLDPDKDLILEVGAILYDIAEEKALWRSTWIVAPEGVCFAPMDKIVYEMHTKNGLFAEMAANDDFTDMLDAEHEILDMLRDFELGPQQCIMAGFTPSFDRSFLRVEMEWLERYLHYRLLDVSTLRTLEKVWTGKNPEKIDRHRALPDCEEAVAELLRFKRMWPGLVTP